MILKRWGRGEKIGRGGWGGKENIILGFVCFLYVFDIGIDFFFLIL